MSDVAPDDFSQGQTVPQQVVAHTLGQKLAVEREARDWTIDYVAGQLNLAVRQIQALETDNYAALPGIASVRGFVRAYAKLLRVDPDPLVALIASEQIVPNQPLEPKPNLSSTPFSHTRLSGGSGTNSNSVKGIALALVVVLLAVTAIGIEHMGGWPTLSQSLANQFGELVGKGGSSQPSNDGAASGAAKPSSEPDSAKDAGASDTREPVKETLTSPAPEAQTPASTAPAQASAPDTVASAAPAQSAVATSAAQPAAAPKAAGEPAPAGKSAAAAGAGTLVLSARQNSWVDVRAGGNVIVSHLLRTGDTETFEIPGAATLTIGNAAGVDATYRGQPLSGGVDGKSNVAHISLK